jgi:hypothetical protein
MRIRPQNFVIGLSLMTGLAAAAETLHAPFGGEETARRLLRNAFSD